MFSPESVLHTFASKGEQSGNAAHTPRLGREAEPSESVSGATILRPSRLILLYSH